MASNPRAQRKHKIIGVASGIGATNTSCHSAPLVLQHLDAANHLGAQWLQTLHNNPNIHDALPAISQLSTDLAQLVTQCVKNEEFFTVFGGDHSCAVGTWSGAAQAIAPDELGLIWIDAHMDAHTPDTSPSGSIHGMPVACLLGEGPAELVDIGYHGAKLKPQNIVQLGIRSFEAGESERLNGLGVKIIYMDELREKGYAAACKEAIAQLKANCKYVGVSIDLDAIDPLEAPGVGSIATHGIAVAQLKPVLTMFAEQLPLIGCEIAELNPTRDIQYRTAHLAIELAQLLSA
jgi:arginase